MLAASHTFAIGCQLRLQSSEGSRLLDVQWLTVMAVDTGCQLGAHQAASWSAVLNSQPSSLREGRFLPRQLTSSRVSIPRGLGGKWMVFSELA